MVSLIYSLSKRRILIFNCYGRIIRKERELTQGWSLLHMPRLQLVSELICEVVGSVVSPSECFLISKFYSWLPFLNFPSQKLSFTAHSQLVLFCKSSVEIFVWSLSMCKFYCKLTGFFGAWKLTRMININCEQKVHFCFGSREQMLQILLRITEAVMQKPKENQIKDTFAQSMSGLLFRVSIFCVFGTTFPCP